MKLALALILAVGICVVAFVVLSAASAVLSNGNVLDGLRVLAGN